MGAVLEFLRDNSSTLLDAGLGALALRMITDQRRILRLLAEKDVQHEAKLDEHDQRIVVLERKVA